jgi:ribosome-associated protein
MNSQDDFLIEERPPSKSRRKRDAEALQQMGVELLKLDNRRFKACPISDELRDAITLCKQIKSRPALKRQKQLIGKIMRSEDADEIANYLQSLT